MYEQFLIMFSISSDAKLNPLFFIESCNSAAVINPDFEVSIDVNIDFNAVICEFERFFMMIFVASCHSLLFALYLQSALKTSAGIGSFFCSK